MEMAARARKGPLLALRLGRMKDAGRLRPEQISVGKLDNVREAKEIARDRADDPRRRGDAGASTR